MNYPLLPQYLWAIWVQRGCCVLGAQSTSLSALRHLELPWRPNLLSLNPSFVPSPLSSYCFLDSVSLSNSSDPLLGSLSLYPIIPASWDTCSEVLTWKNTSASPTPRLCHYVIPTLGR